MDPNLTLSEMGHFPLGRRMGPIMSGLVSCLVKSCYGHDVLQKWSLRHEMGLLSPGKLLSWLMHERFILLRGLCHLSPEMVVRSGLMQRLTRDSECRRIVTAENSFDGSFI